MTPEPAEPSTRSSTSGSMLDRDYVLADLRIRVPAQALMQQVLTTVSDNVPLSADQRAWFTGALGERRVAQVLADLGPEWTVLHSVPIGSGDSDIDHVVIGPSGVFTLNTKHHRGKAIWVGGRGMMVGGHKVSYIRNAAHEASRTADLLSTASELTVEVTGLIVLVGAGELTVRRKADGGDVTVEVIRDRQLLPAIRRRRIYSDAQVQQIVAVAARPETWHARPTASVDTAQLILDFDALTAGITASDSKTRNRRAGQRLMTTVGATAVAVAACVTFGAIVIGLLAQ